MNRLFAIFGLLEAAMTYFVHLDNINGEIVI